MDNSLLTDKSFAFAKRIVRAYKFLRQQQEYVMSRQLLRSGTSIGANITEAMASLSDQEFSAKLSIAYKEVKETGYWLRLLHETEFIDLTTYDSIH